MKNLLSTLIAQTDINDFKNYLTYITEQKQHFLLRNDVLLLFEEYCELNQKPADFRTGSSIYVFLRKIQELLIWNSQIAIMHRHMPARYRFYLLSRNGDYMEEMDVAHHLDLKDQYVQGATSNGSHLHIDFLPFHDYYPSIRDARSLGNGIRFLNRYLCSNIFNRPGEWHAKLFDFIKLHKHQDQQLLVNPNMIQNVDAFVTRLEQMIRRLVRLDSETPAAALENQLQQRGFEAGWGNTAQRIHSTMQLLLDLFNEPTDALLEEFITRVPMPLVSKVAIVSPHGWFAQSDVLGKPDTGGQVIYILDQVRALEKYLQESIRLTGLTVTPHIVVLTRRIPEAGNTTCNQAREKIFKTSNGWILRLPFRDDQGAVLPEWISRFKIWPYLEGFAEEASHELLAEFQGRPDLIIGNYSDGNLVATRLSDKLDVVQCTIAHALEKTKYLFSDLYWREKEPDYHFSLQFTADMLAMNKADFIITSTHQEIIGTEDEMGQYESYQFFTLPGLYQVINGVNLFAPKFNVIPPGVEESLYFPFFETAQRVASQTHTWSRRLFDDKFDDIWGELTDPTLPAIFTMARFDKIKNITGLIEAYGLSPLLQERFNLIFAAGSIHAEDSDDLEEQNEIRRAYALIDQYNLEGKVRWLPSITKEDTGEAYRLIAERQGIFVQPALFEAFGLTILEAMASGLPTFGPRFGGPSEIIEDGRCGFLLNTSQPKLIARGLEAFVRACEKDPNLWQTISKEGIRRVQEHFNWRLYSRKLVDLAKLYGFWRFSVSARGNDKLNRYCDFIHHFLIRERARGEG